VEADDASHSTYAFLRRAGEARPVLVVANFTALTWKEYRLGVPVGDRWIELANSDSAVFGGSGVRALVMDQSEAAPSHGYAQSLVLTVPPLGVVFLAPAAIPEGDIR
jgi:1,4-alpha-glucan branching enzyme